MAAALGLLTDRDGEAFGFEQRRVDPAGEVANGLDRVTRCRLELREQLAVFSAPARSASMRVGPSFTFSATSCCWGPLSRSFSSARRAGPMRPAHVRVTLRARRPVAAARRSSERCGAPDPSPDARSANSSSSAGVIVSPLLLHQRQSSEQFVVVEHRDRVVGFGIVEAVDAVETPRRRLRGHDRAGAEAVVGARPQRRSRRTGAVDDQVRDSIAAAPRRTAPTTAREPRPAPRTASPGPRRPAGWPTARSGAVPAGTPWRRPPTRRSTVRTGVAAEQLTDPTTIATYTPPMNSASAPKVTDRLTIVSMS